MDAALFLSCPRVEKMGVVDVADVDSRCRSGDLLALAQHQAQHLAQFNLLSEATGDVEEVMGPPIPELTHSRSHTHAWHTWG